MADRPLGIADLMRLTPAQFLRDLPEHWFWCRSHEQAHKAGERCKCDCGPMWPEDSGRHMSKCPERSDCIDCMIGMSEREVLRLAGGWVGFDAVKPEPLGMEVEK